MYLDELAVEQQETATYCQACSEVLARDEMTQCPHCGYLICGKPGCNRLCSCDDGALDLMLEWGYSSERVHAIRQGKAWKRESLAYGIAKALATLKNESIANQGVATA